jgi:predicted membrane protein
MRNLIGILILVITILIFTSTNPKKEEHQKVVDNYLLEIWSNSMKENSDSEIEMTEEYSLIIEKGKNEFFNTVQSEYNDYFIFSTLSLKFVGDSTFETATIGLLNRCTLKK